MFCLRSVLFVLPEAGSHAEVHGRLAAGGSSSHCPLVEASCNVALKERAGGHPGDPAAGEPRTVVAPHSGTAELESEPRVSGSWLRRDELAELLLETALEDGH